MEADSLPEPNKVKACVELDALKKIISWQIGFAVEGILRYRRLGLKEMEAWSRGRLVTAKVLLLGHGFRPSRELSRLTHLLHLLLLTRCQVLLNSWRSRT